MSFGSIGAYVPVPNVGGGGGSTQDYFAPAIIVGNSAQGDTLQNCHYLDWAGIQSALNDSFVNYQATGVAKDIWIRPGRYLCVLGAIPNDRFTVRAVGQVIRGTGRSCVTIEFVQNQTAFEFLAPGFQFENVVLVENGGTVAAYGSALPGAVSYFGATFPEGSPELPFVIDSVSIYLNSIGGTAQTDLRGGFYFTNAPTGYAATSRIQNCQVFNVNNNFFPFDSIDVFANTFGFLFEPAQQQLSYCEIVNCEARRLETGFASNSISLSLRDCIYYSPYIDNAGPMLSSNVVGFYSGGLSPWFFVERCQALISQDSGTGYRFDGSTVQYETDSAVWPVWNNNHVRSFGNPQALVTGYSLIGRLDAVIKGAVLTGNTANGCSIGYSVNDYAQYTSSTSNVARACLSPVSDPNDDACNDILAHVQIIP